IFQAGSAPALRSLRLHGLRFGVIATERGGTARGAFTNIRTLISHPTDERATGAPSPPGMLSLSGHPADGLINKISLIRDTPLLSMSPWCLAPLREQRGIFFVS